MGTAPIVQNKAFFQVDITQTGKFFKCLKLLNTFSLGAWGVGLARRSVDLEKVPVLNEAYESLRVEIIYSIQVGVDE